MKQAVLNKINKLADLYAKFNPLFWQYHYCRKTLHAKQNAIRFEHIDDVNNKRIRQLWGG